MSDKETEDKMKEMGIHKQNEICKTIALGGSAWVRPNELDKKRGDAVRRRILKRK